MRYFSLCFKPRAANVELSRERSAHAQKTNAMWDEAPVFHGIPCCICASLQWLRVLTALAWGWHMARKYFLLILVLGCREAAPAYCSCRRLLALLVPPPPFSLFLHDHVPRLQRRVWPAHHYLLPRGTPLPSRWVTGKNRSVMAEGPPSRQSGKRSSPLPPPSPRAVVSESIW